jgi:hypothetical protein
MPLLVVVRGIKMNSYGNDVKELMCVFSSVSISERMFDLEIGVVIVLIVERSSVWFDVRFQ